MSREIQKPVRDFHPNHAFIVRAKPLELEAFNFNLAVAEKRCELQFAAIIEIFLGVRLEGNLRGGFFLWLVSKRLHVGVNVLQLFFKGPFRTAIREENFSLIDSNFIYPVTEGFLVGFLLLLWSLFAFALHDQRSQV